MLKTNFKVVGLLALLSLAPNLKAPANYFAEIKAQMDSKLGDFIQRHKHLQQIFAECARDALDKDEQIEALKKDLRGFEIERDANSQAYQQQCLLKDEEIQKLRQENAVLLEYKDTFNRIEEDYKALQQLNERTQESWARLQNDKQTLESELKKIVQQADLDKSQAADAMEKLLRENSLLRQQLEDESRQANESVKSWIDSISRASGDGQDLSTEGSFSLLDTVIHNSAAVRPNGCKTAVLNSAPFFRSASPASTVSSSMFEVVEEGLVKKLTFSYMTNLHSGKICLHWFDHQDGRFVVCDKTQIVDYVQHNYPMDREKRREESLFEVEIPSSLL